MHSTGNRAGSAGFQPARGPSVARTNDHDRAGSAGFQPARWRSPRNDDQPDLKQVEPGAKTTAVEDKPGSKQAGDRDASGLKRKLTRLR